jgi:hypothetical protein
VASHVIEGGGSGGGRGRRRRFPGGGRPTCHVAGVARSTRPDQGVRGGCHGFEGAKSAQWNVGASTQHMRGSGRLFKSQILAKKEIHNEKMAYRSSNGCGGGFRTLTVQTSAASDNDRDNDKEYSFSDRDIRGPYASVLFGTVDTIPLASTAQFVGDGRGSVTGTLTINFDGEFREERFTCNHSVRPDGTFYSRCSNGQTFVGVLYDKGRAAHFISDVPGVILRGNFIRQ